MKGLDVPVRISGFRATGIISDNELRELLDKRLPQAATRFIDAIVYVDTYHSRMRDDLPLTEVLRTGTHTRSTHIRESETGREEIHVFRQAPTGTEDLQDLCAAIFEEIGYSLFKHDDLGVREKWAKVQSGPGETSNLSLDALTADFCRCFRRYYLDPDALLRQSSEKYRVLDDLNSGLAELKT